MTRWFGVGAACACLFLVAGCTLDSFTLNAFGTAKGDGPVVAGSLDVVAASAQSILRDDMQLFVTVHKNSDTVKLAARTKAGKDFVLVLKARKTDHGDETQLSIQWKGDADDAFWIQLAAASPARSRRRRIRGPAMNMPSRRRKCRPIDADKGTSRMPPPSRKPSVARRVAAAVLLSLGLHGLIVLGVVVRAGQSAGFHGGRRSHAGPAGLPGPRLG